LDTTVETYTEVERPRPQRGRAPDLLMYLQAAYLEEKALAERLESWAKLSIVPSVARGILELAKRSRVQARALEEAVRELRGVPAEASALARPLREPAEARDLRDLLQEGVAAKKRIQIFCLDAASLAETEGLVEMGRRLEVLRREAEAGRKDLLSLVTKLPPFRAED
jgi:hypothetical protein